MSAASVLTLVHMGSDVVFEAVRMEEMGPGLHCLEDVLLLLLLLGIFFFTGRKPRVSRGQYAASADVVERAGPS